MHNKAFLNLLTALHNGNQTLDDITPVRRLSMTLFIVVQWQPSYYAWHSSDKPKINHELGITAC
ncbi:hypothetical protein [Pseudoalteromonas rubra]|uniref:hypothetical protein n=1 Tax=Pseudoalteromonas rubra TaxID=43658 RepID=UPI001108A71E|nr:hypothetical protein [Pseudoalteromonas rubra]